MVQPEVAGIRCALNRPARRAVLQGGAGPTARHLTPEGPASPGRREADAASVTLTGAGRPWVARTGSVLAVTFLMILAGSCDTGRAPGPSGPAPSPPTGGSAAPGNNVKALASRYLAIAVPANHRLDSEVDGFTRHEHTDLAVAERDLRAEAATERWFDQRLAKIPFSPGSAGPARALIRANQNRAELTGRQARSATITALQSFTGRHRAADAAVEVQVRVIRRALGLPPPSNS